MLEKRDWLRKRWDRIRRALLTEPRGHVDLCGGRAYRGCHTGGLTPACFSWTPVVFPRCPATG